ncbi:ABC1-domain-containing protein [Microthyrium microscopicum]|uniref:ABC1-domain-containing protein n=1 Tax=Microthyrium microscopicum TaxID=703497 RepID=A0A6A6UAW4_9PEZI|nr:ABC1-domain-containing protein [Microthyrium microscopicum]
MAGRRFMDVTRLVQATRSVAKQHIALRSDQFDVFNRTSTLAKAAKDQTDRVTLTVKAAVVLAQRLGEDVKTSAQNVNPYPTSDDNYQRTQKEDFQRTSTRHDSAESTIDATGPLDQTATSATNYTPSIPRHVETDLRDSSEAKQTGINSDVFPQPSEFEAPRGSSNVRASKPPTASTGASTTKQSIETPDQGDISSTTDLEHPTTNHLKDSSNINTSSHLPPDDPTTQSEVSIESPKAIPFQMRESRVPSTRIGRLWQYGNLGVSMAVGAMGESLRRVTGGGSTGSVLLSPGNLEKLVARLSRMRGAALKLGQMVSFQDLKMLPPEIHNVLQRVQDSADYMPASQRDSVLSRNLGSDWRDLFSRFDEVPVAAASIGQVHRAAYKATGDEVAVKIQYPGVATSIDSDLSNISILLTASKLLPSGLFLDKTIANARTELAWECDYIREAECARRFRTLLSDDENVFKVPRIFDDACGKEVLTAEFMDGTAVTKLPNLSQQERDWIGTNILRLCLREICDFQFMQTDPNWTNFLYNGEEHKLELLDFGASREYPLEFITNYVHLLDAAARQDSSGVEKESILLGYLTGHESKEMVKAHIESIITLSEPFGDTAPDVFDFKDQTITDRVRSLIPLMLRERLSPPPEETYSLHRKLSGAFLLCARLGSRVRCREMFQKAIVKYGPEAVGKTQLVGGQYAWQNKA